MLKLYGFNNNLNNMSFGNRLKEEEHLKRLFLFLGTDEQQEFLERAKLLKLSKERLFKESILDNLSLEEHKNEEKYNYLLDKAVILSRMSIEDRLGFLLLTSEDQQDYIELYLKMRTILESDGDDDTGNNEFNLNRYDLLLEKIKSRYLSRSLLKNNGF